MRKIICVTGTPGTGKTTFSKHLAKNIKGLYIDLNKIIKNFPELFDAKYNKKHDTYDVDIELLIEIMLNIINSTKKSFIFDSHLSHYLPSQYTDLCVVMKCDLKTLKKRLSQRGYSKEKIQDNLQAEIMEVCLIEAQESNHKIKEIHS